jgi:hypothetical protein
VNGEPLFGCQLCRAREANAFITLGIDSRVSSINTPQFNLAGTHVAWGNTDGTVTVCDLPEINRRLKNVGLDWQE